MANDEPKVWRFLEGISKSELEDKLNELSLQGYQVYRLDRIHELNVVSYDAVLFNPVLLSTRHAADMHKALKEAGVDVGPTSKTGS
jgi:hypothetical protein